MEDKKDKRQRKIRKRRTRLKDGGREHGRYKGKKKDEKGRTGLKEKVEKRRNNKRRKTTIMKRNEGFFFVMSRVSRS
jgi:hypothetical protein